MENRDTSESQNTEAQQLETDTEPAAQTSQLIRLTDMLDDAEVTRSRTVCNGEDSPDALVEVSEEPPGEICPAGGQRIDIGVDDDADGALDADEIRSSHTICNGTGGTGGSITTPRSSGVKLSRSTCSAPTTPSSPACIPSWRPEAAGWWESAATAPCGPCPL